MRACEEPLFSRSELVRWPPLTLTLTPTNTQSTVDRRCPVFTNRARDAREAAREAVEAATRIQAIQRGKKDRRTAKEKAKEKAEER